MHVPKEYKVVKLVKSVEYNTWNFTFCSFFYPFVDYVMSHEKRYQALPAFPYCKQQKAGLGLGTRL